MTEPPDQPKSPTKPSKRRQPPIRTERFLGAWRDVVWLQPLKPIAPEADSPPSTSEDSAAKEDDP